MIRLMLKFTIGYKIQAYIYKYTSLNFTESAIIENGISLSLSFLIVGIIKKYGLHRYNLSLNPYNEFISIILSTIIMIFMYEIYRKFKITKEDANRGFSKDLMEMDI
jgi:hypothetical protein